MSATFIQSTNGDGIDSPDSRRSPPKKFCCCFRRSTQRIDGYNFPNKPEGSTNPSPNKNKVTPSSGHVQQGKDKKISKPFVKGRETDSNHLGDKISELNIIKNSATPQDNSPNRGATLKLKNPCLDDSTDHPFIKKNQKSEDHNQTSPDGKYQNDLSGKQKFPLSGVQEVSENRENSSHVPQTENSSKKSKILSADSQGLIRLEQHTTFNINFTHELADPNFDAAINITKSKIYGKGILGQPQLKKYINTRGSVKEKPNPYGRSNSKGLKKKDCPPADRSNLIGGINTLSSEFTPNERSNYDTEYHVQQRIEEIKEEEEYYEDGSISRKSKLTKKTVTKEITKKPVVVRSRTPSKKRSMGEIRDGALVKSPEKVRQDLLRHSSSQPGSRFQSNQELGQHFKQTGQNLARADTLQVVQTNSTRKSSNDSKKRTFTRQDSMGDFIEEMAKNVVAKNSSQQATELSKFSEACRKSSQQKQDSDQPTPCQSPVKGQPRISHGFSLAKVPRQQTTITECTTDQMTDRQEFLGVESYRQNSINSTSFNGPIGSPSNARTSGVITNSKDAHGENISEEDSIDSFPSIELESSNSSLDMDVPVAVHEDSTYTSTKISTLPKDKSQLQSDKQYLGANGRPSTIKTDINLINDSMLSLDGKPEAAKQRSTMPIHQLQANISELHKLQGIDKRGSQQPRKTLPLPMIGFVAPCPDEEEEDGDNIRVMHEPMQRRTEYRNTWNKNATATLPMHHMNAKAKEAQVKKKSNGRSSPRLDSPRHDDRFPVELVVQTGDTNWGTGCQKNSDKKSPGVSTQSPTTRLTGTLIHDSQLTTGTGGGLLRSAMRTTSHQTNNSWKSKNQGSKSPNRTNLDNRSVLFGIETVHNVKSFKKDNVVPEDELPVSRSPTKSTRDSSSKGSEGFDKLSRDSSPLKKKKTVHPRQSNLAIENRVLGGARVSLNPNLKKSESKSPKKGQGVNLLGEGLADLMQLMKKPGDLEDEEDDSPVKHRNSSKKPPIQLKKRDRSAYKL